MKVLDKPSGVTTHTSLHGEETKRVHVDPIDGFLEHLSAKSGKALWPVHRLDVGTTGVCLAAESAEEAAQWSTQFESRAVEKTYYFLTDRKPRKGFEVGGRLESHIARIKSPRPGTRGSSETYASYSPTASEPINAVTKIEPAESFETFSLWKAQPETGKPHQIRLHAEAMGLSILGDTEHGGSDFPALCLHAARVETKNFTATAELPRWFKDLKLLSSKPLVQWLHAIERRERLWRSLGEFRVNRPSLFRWIHTDGGNLRADALGEVLHFQYYGNELSSSDMHLIEKLAHLINARSWYLQVRGNRGRTPNAEDIILSSEPVPERWIGEEGPMKLELRRDSGLSPGLFLDQRVNRAWVAKQTKDKSVLNLFCYTGAFSVAAALGDATKCVSVDVSKNFIEWSKINFRANGLDPADPRYEFRDIETMAYLKWAQKKRLEVRLGDLRPAVLRTLGVRSVSN